MTHQRVGRLETQKENVTGSSRAVISRLSDRVPGPLSDPIFGGRYR